LGVEFCDVSALQAQNKITGQSRQILFEGLPPQTQDLHGFFWEENGRGRLNGTMTSRSIFDFLSLYVASTISSNMVITPSANRCPNTNRWFLGKLSTCPSTHFVKSYHLTSTTGGSLRRVIAFRCQKSSDSKISPNPMNDDAQSPGLLLVKKIARRPRAARRKKEKG